MLKAGEAHLSDEAREIERIRQHLQDLGSDMDRDLCDQIKRHMGVPEQPVHTRSSDEAWDRRRTLTPECSLSPRATPTLRGRL